MASFRCRECGTPIPVKQHGALAGMEVEGPCPKCGNHMPFICPKCNKGIAGSLICDHGEWKGLCCMKSGCCYIATACYGDYDHPDVQTFRRYRDKVLLPSRWGRLFVTVYYMLSPPIAGRLGHVRWLSGLVRRRFLEPLASRIRHSLQA